MTFTSSLDSNAPESGRGGGHKDFAPDGCSDLGNAERFVRDTSGEFSGPWCRFVPHWKKWIYWDGKRWEIDQTGDIYYFAKQTIRKIYSEAAAAENDTRRKQLARHAGQSESAASITNMLRLAQTEIGIAIKPDDLDGARHLVTCLSHTLDLSENFQARAHELGDLITKLAPVEYRRDVGCPRWEDFLHEIMNGRSELVRFLQRAVGYSLTGETSERCLFFLHGGGRNGKTTLLEVLRDILGDYAMQTPPETLLAKRPGGIPNDVARLKGARFVTAAETPDGRRMAEALIKGLTGGDTISARFMRGEWFDFAVEAKIWLCSNHKPIISGTDPAIWDRILMIPFDVRFEGDQVDKGLRDKLLAERIGIFRWAVDGAREWRRDGLKVPDEVRAATQCYRTENDVLGAFLGECCVSFRDASVVANELHKAYTAWAKENGEEPLSCRKLGDRLRERGFETKKDGNGYTRWQSLGLHQHPRD